MFKSKFNISCQDIVKTFFYTMGSELNSVQIPVLKVDHSIIGISDMIKSNCMEFSKINPLFVVFNTYLW